MLETSAAATSPGSTVAMMLKVLAASFTMQLSASDASSVSVSGAGIPISGGGTISSGGGIISSGGGIISSGGTTISSGGGIISSGGAGSVAH